jgi:transcriptional accessory protein Tex/SPT6
MVKKRQSNFKALWLTQKVISPHKLHTAFEMVLVEYTNLLGTNLQDFSQFNHRDAKAQFICGLGAIKAKDFVKKTKDLGRSIKSRNELQNLHWFPSRVEEMVLGFIKFDQSTSESEIYPLDATRIHPVGKPVFSALIALLIF